MGSESPKLSLAILGCGTMATAMLSTLLSNTPLEENKFNHIYCCVTSSQSAARLEKALPASPLVEIIIGNNLHAAQCADIVLLGHKPYGLRTVLGEAGMSSALDNKLIISVVGGISSDQIRTELQNNNVSVLRAVPNMAASVGESMTIIETPETSIPPPLLSIGLWFLSRVGKTMTLPAVLLDVSTVVVGAGIALATVFVDGMLDGSVAEGIPRAKALEIAAQCLLGTAKLLQQGEHPAVVRESISSPRGCTIQALMHYERANARAACADAVVHATAHVKKMGKQD